MSEHGRSKDSGHMKVIHASLERLFQRSRLVFWYDGHKEWGPTFDAFELEGVTKLKVAGTEFGTKVRIVRDPDPGARFLVYVPSARPADTENWLLDLLLQGHEFKADRASLVLQEVGLPHDFRFLVEEHAAFFQSSTRVKALKELVAKDDEPSDLRLKMMSVLAGTPVDVDALMLHFLSKGAGTPLLDPVADVFGPSALVQPFWTDVARRFGTDSRAPSLRDFVVSLFRGANPLDPQVSLRPHAVVFLQRWKDSAAHRETFRTWSGVMATDLRIESTLGGQEGDASLGEWDTFEVFEKFTLRQLCRAFQADASAAELRSTIQRRRSSFWAPEYRDGYEALAQAVELRELLESIDLSVESVDAGLSRYVSSWWRVDTAYRRCIFHLRTYGQVQLMEPISKWVEKNYVAKFLLPLADRWGDQVRALERWESDAFPAQRRFFETYVRPFLDKGQKVFVIISDALRFEAAQEFASRLESENRWTAKVEAVLSSLPSYTQLGMAALLPGHQIAVDPNNGTTTVDGRSATGTENRAEILRRACNSKATAIQANEFLNLNTKTDGRDLMRDHEVIYIYHDVIDKVGDKLATEAKTFDAVEDAFEELLKILRKVVNINGTNMLLTADHGFLFQQDEVQERDMAALPRAECWNAGGRRYNFGRGITSSPAVKVFSASNLGLSGDWTAAFPMSLGRFPVQGSGKRFVHGGFSLQEIVVPVVRIHKARTNDTGRVEVELLRVPPKITTGLVSLSLYQDRAAVDKALPRTLRVGVFAKDRTPISDAKTQTFDSKDTEARRRESTLILTLSHAADAYNNQEVDILLEEAVPGTSQFVTYKSHSLRLQKPFESDFDDL